MSIAEAGVRLAAALSGEVRRDELMARHTSYRIGGPAALWVRCDTLADLAAATSILAEEDVQYVAVGKGTNLLVADEGYPGAVVVLGKEFARHSVDGEFVQAGAAVILASLVNDAFAQGLSGLEFAVGVPGTFGGAVAMNAGTRDDWIGSMVESVTLFVPGVGLERLRGAEVPWGYRRSGLQGRGIIVEAVLKVTPGDPVTIRRVMEANFRRRKGSQPVGSASAGSVFKNPEGDSAGRLIEAAGLKGARVGKASISEVHANFIVNEGGARAADVVSLIQLARDTVKDRYGVELSPEIRFLGTFPES